jgi:hypothetical protein
MKYETLSIYDRKPIGPLRIPVIPPGINPEDILPLIIDEIKKEENERPYAPLRIPEKPEQIH